MADDLHQFNRAYCCQCLEKLKYDIRILPCRKHRICGLQSGKSCLAIVLAQAERRCPSSDCGVLFPATMNIINLPNVNSPVNPDRNKNTYQQAGPTTWLYNGRVIKKEKIASNPDEKHSSPTPVGSSDSEAEVSQLWVKTRTEKGPGSAYLVDDVRMNGRKKLLVIGKTGTGKSSLCNVLTGVAHDASVFPVSSGAESCTLKTQMANVFYNGEGEKPVTLIDTEGFDATNDLENDARIIGELIATLQNKCDYVNVFCIAINANNRRLDGALVGMMKVFEQMFGHDFWEQVVIVFTQFKMSQKAIRRRQNNENQTDQKLADAYIKTLRSKFKNAGYPRCLFIDSLRDDGENDQDKQYQEAVDELYQLLDKSPSLDTKEWSNERKFVEGRNKLQRNLKDIDEAQKQEELERQELREKLQQDCWKQVPEDYRKLLKQINDNYEETSKSEKEIRDENKRAVEEIWASQKNEIKNDAEMNDQILALQHDKNRLETELKKNASEIESLKTVIEKLDNTVRIKMEKASVNDRNGRPQMAKVRPPTAKSRADQIEMPELQSMQASEEELIEKEKQNRDLLHKANVLYDRQRALEILKKKQQDKEALTGEKLQQVIIKRLEEEAKYKKGLRQLLLLNQYSDKELLKGWQNAALKILQETKGPNMTKGMNIRDFLADTYHGSTWFVYIINKNDKWVHKFNSGTKECWKSDPKNSGCPKSGTPCDLLIWGKLLEREERYSSNCNWENVANAIVEDAQDKESETEAIAYIVEKLEENRVPWLQVLVAPYTSVTRVSYCHENYCFTHPIGGGSFKFFIEVYTGG